MSQVTSYQPDNIAELLADEVQNSVFRVAPAEKQKPVSRLEYEADCFPSLLPRGRGTFIDLKDKNPDLTLSMYAKARLQSYENRFAMNSEYVFFLQSELEEEKIRSSISVAIRKGKSSQHLSPSNFQNVHSVKEVINTDTCYRTFNTVRGSPFYWSRFGKDILAMVKQIGPPTFFCSFSAADRRWPEFAKAILVQQGRVDDAALDEYIENLSWTEYCTVINQNPVSALEMFNRRFEHFQREVILSNVESLGKIKAYVSRIEFQSRGWPHRHCLYWSELGNCETLSTDEMEKIAGAYVTCELPSNDDPLYQTVLEVQRHSKGHSKTCRKTGKTCRFGFPHPPSENVFMTGNKISCKQVPQETLNNLGKKVTNLKTALEDIDSAISTEELLQKFDLTQEDLELFLKCTSKKDQVFLKRSPQEIWINNYNKILLPLWNGNCDVQLVLSIESLIYYLIGYVSKGERSVMRIVEEAKKEARQGNVEPIAELRKLGNAYLTNREISVMEAITRAYGFPLTETPTTVVYLPVDPLGNRITKPLSTLQNLSENDSIFASNIIDYYLSRPEDLQDYCLADFASWYYKVPESRKSEKGVM